MRLWNRTYWLRVRWQWYWWRFRRGYQVTEIDGAHRSAIRWAVDCGPFSLWRWSGPYDWLRPLIRRDFRENRLVWSCPMHGAFCPACRLGVRVSVRQAAKQTRKGLLKCLPWWQRWYYGRMK